MPLDEKLLKFLCCPVTKVPVIVLPEDRLVKLNELIQKGQVKDKEGNPVETSLEEALITEDEKTIYTVNSGIPIMLQEKGIPTDQLQDF